MVSRLLDHKRAKSIPQTWKPKFIGKWYPPSGRALMLLLPPWAVNFMCYIFTSRVKIQVDLFSIQCGGSDAKRHFVVKGERRGKKESIAYYIHRVITFKKGLHEKNSHPFEVIMSHNHPFEKLSAIVVFFGHLEECLYTYMGGSLERIMNKDGRSSYFTSYERESKRSILWRKWAKQRRIDFWMR